MVVAFFEFPDEVDAYRREKQFRDTGSTSTILISLNPQTHAHLRHLGHSPETSSSYFDSNSHAFALRKSKEISDWVWQRAQFQDNLGVSFAYTQSLVWYIRIFVHHCLWLIEIMHNATARHDAKGIQACASPARVPLGHVIGPRERYLGTLAERFGKTHGLEVELIGSPTANRVERSRREVFRDIQRFLAARILAPIAARAYRSYLRRLGARQPVLFTAHQYRMTNVAGVLTKERRDLSMVFMREWGNLQGLAGLFKSKDGSPYEAEAWLGLLEPRAPEEKGSRQSLQMLLKRLSAEIDAARDVFSYKGVSFAGLVNRKLDKGIGPFILGLHRRTATLRLLLDTLRPSTVLSTGSREDDMITGELCRAAGLPAMLISHGSHVFPKNDLERIEWGEQGHRLLRAPYPFVALQSPLAEDFLKAFPSTSRAVRTGPLVWGCPVDRKQSALLRQRLVGGNLARRVIVHASTPKGRGAHRLHVYETPDEYVQSICELVAAVKGLPDVHLVVKFRPSPDISVKDLQALMPPFERITVSVKEPFLDVLGFADLLVSFSSTTIEEALQNRVPVLMYGGSGRYQHVPGVELTPEASCPRAAVYVVRQPEHLTIGLRRILDTHTRGDTCEDLFAPYCFKDGDRTRLADWLASSASPVMRDAATF